jgi:DNA-binding response OmpR family regulator
VSQRILIIDDDGALASMVAEYLGRAGFEVQHAGDAATGLKRLDEEHFDALVLDVMLPGLDGFEVLRRVARELPVVMLTARGEDTDRIVGLELGADDYLPKPFNPRELLARLRAVLRRGQAPPAGEVLGFGRLEIDRERRQARLDGEPCRLTGHQFDILLALADSAGRVLSRDAIMDRVSGHAPEAFDRSIDVHVSRIRAAIEEDPRHPRRIVTVRGTGYLFVRRQDEL